MCPLSTTNSYYSNVIVIVRPAITHPYHCVSRPEEVDWNDQRKLASSTYVLLLLNILYSGVGLAPLAGVRC